MSTPSDQITNPGTTTTPAPSTPANNPLAPVVPVTTAPPAATPPALPPVVGQVAERYGEQTANVAYQLASNAQDFGQVLAAMAQMDPNAPSSIVRGMIQIFGGQDLFKKWLNETHPTVYGQEPVTPPPAATPPDTTSVDALGLDDNPLAKQVAELQQQLSSILNAQKEAEQQQLIQQQGQIKDKALYTGINMAVDHLKQAFPKATEDQMNQLVTIVGGALAQNSVVQNAVARLEVAIANNNTLEEYNCSRILEQNVPAVVDQVLKVYLGGTVSSSAALNGGLSAISTPRVPVPGSGYSPLNPNPKPAGAKTPQSYIQAMKDLAAQL